LTFALLAAFAGFGDAFGADDGFDFDAPMFIIFIAIFL
jgi:hypothetical protein